MRVHHLQHVPFEDLGSMGPFFLSGRHEMTSSHMYRGDRLPDTDAFDFLIIMGGPMGVYDEKEYPFMQDEKTFIKHAIDRGKKVLGICLGAQLIAEVMGAAVTKNKHREIGWFPLSIDPRISNTVLAGCFPEKLNVFHWHGDRFEIPQGATPLASSMACDHQGFIKDNRIVGLQFHLETTMESARALINHCGSDLDGSYFVQAEHEILSEPERFERINRVMHDVLCGLMLPH